MFCYFDYMQTILKKQIFLRMVPLEKQADAVLSVHPFLKSMCIVQETLLETACFTSKPILFTQNIDIKSKKESNISSVFGL